MNNDLKNYIQELEQLKKTGLVDSNQMAEVDNLIQIMQNLGEGDLNTGSVSVGSDEYKVKIKFVNTSRNEDPVYAKEGDSGFDLRAELTEMGGKLTLKPFERVLIPTGLYFELPQGYEMQVRPRSGLSFKTGLMAILGTVDTGYRGEVKVIMINLSDKEVTIEQGERVAQGVVASRISTDFGQLIKLHSVTQLSETERGSGGFGSTGRN